MPSVTHWFDLKLEVIPERFVKPSEGPFDDGGLTQRIRELISLERDAYPRLPHRTSVLRNDVVEVRHFRRDETGWHSELLDGLPCAPSGTSGITASSGSVILVPAFGEGNPPWTFATFEHEATIGRKIGAFKAATWDEFLVAQIARSEVQVIAGNMSRIAEIWGQHMQPKDKARPQSGGGVSAGEVEAPPGEIVGFRTWKMCVPSALAGDQVAEAEPQLFGFYPFPSRIGASEWKEIEVDAQCPEIRGHEAPEEGCDCGIHAWHAAKDALDMHDKKVTTAEFSRWCSVSGIVLGSGTVFVYNDGWRGQTVRVIAFCSEVEVGFAPALAHLARRFDVPVLTPDELEEFAQRKGVVIRKDDLPDGPTR